MNSTSLSESTIFLSNASAPVFESWFIPTDILMIISITLTIVLATLFLSVIILDKTCHTVSMILIANSCLATLIFGCITLSMRLFSLHNDLKQIQFQDSPCILRAYFVYAAGTVLNYSFCIQSMHRYITVVYPNRVFWQSVRFQVVIIALTWMFAYSYSIAFIHTGAITYNVDNQICQIPLRFSAPVLCEVFCIYLIPVSLITGAYWKLVRYVHRIRQRVTSVNALVRAQRELQMLRGIIIIVVMLVVFGFPFALFIMISFFTHPPRYHFRIALLFVDVSLTSVMIALFQFTKPLKVAIM